MEGKGFLGRDRPMNQLGELEYVWHIQGDNLSSLIANASGSCWERKDR